MAATDSKVTLMDILIRWKWLLCGLGILATGIGLIGLSQVLSELWSKFVETVGIGLLPTGSFILIYEYGLRKEYQKLVREEFDTVLKEFGRRCAECEKFGLLSLSEKRESCHIEKPFEKAKKGDTISVLGVALADLVDFDRSEKILEAIQKGCKVRLLYLDPDCDEAIQHSLDEGRNRDEVTNAIKGTESIWRSSINSLPASSQQLLEIRKYRSSPKHFIMIHRDGVYVGDYLGTRRGNKCPHFLLRADSPIARQHVAHFENLWTHACVMKSVVTERTPANSGP